MQLVIVFVVFFGIAGCETVPEPRASASRPRSASLGTPSLPGSYHVVRRGETLWRIANGYGVGVDTLARANRLQSTNQISVGQKLFVPLPAETRKFLWPARGPIDSPGPNGVQITAPAGSLIRASRTGRVAVATQQLSGWGKTVILDHADGYLTIYSGLEQLLAAPGTSIRQGAPVGRVGARALHFEIRYGNQSKNTLALLPPK